MSTWHIATHFNTADGSPSDTRVEAASVEFEANATFVTFKDGDGDPTLVIPTAALLYAKRLAND